MGIFKKLKDVLFDIEEEDLPVITKKEIKKDNVVRKEENIIKEIKLPREELPERELMKSESTFNFPLDFDDEPLRKRNNDFQTKSVKSKTINDYDDLFDTSTFSRKPIKEEYSRKTPNVIVDPYKPAPRETKSDKPFKPSPIISPVYGILDQNYSKDDVIVKTDIGVKGPDLDEVRKKAYGIENKKKTPVILEEPIIEDKVADSLKTLDAILMENTSPKIEIEEELPQRKTPELKEELKAEVKPLKKEEIFGEEISNIDEDTSETDLFNLIDSMYEDREEREEE